MVEDEKIKKHAADQHDAKTQHTKANIGEFASASGVAGIPLDGGMNEEIENCSLPPIDQKKKQMF